MRSDSEVEVVEVRLQQEESVNQGQQQQSHLLSQPKRPNFFIVWCMVAIVVFVEVELMLNVPSLSSAKRRELNTEQDESRVGNCHFIFDRLSCSPGCCIQTHSRIGVEPALCEPCHDTSISKYALRAGRQKRKRSFGDSKRSFGDSMGERSFGSYNTFSDTDQTAMDTLSTPVNMKSKTSTDSGILQPSGLERSNHDNYAKNTFSRSSSKASTNRNVDSTKDIDKVEELLSALKKASLPD